MSPESFQGIRLKIGVGPIFNLRSSDVLALSSNQTKVNNESNRIMRNAKRQTFLAKDNKLNCPLKVV